MEALAGRGAELTWVSALLSATVDCRLAGGTRRDRWSYDCDRVSGWLIILLDEIFRTAIEDCAVEFMLASRAVSRCLDAFWNLMLAIIHLRDGERLTIHTAIVVGVLEELAVRQDLAEPALISIACAHALVPGNLAVFVTAVVGSPSGDWNGSCDGEFDSISLPVTALRRLYASCSHMLGQS
jgi:hypothetical protein